MMPRASRCHSPCSWLASKTVNIPCMLNWLTKLFSLPGDDFYKGQIMGVPGAGKGTDKVVVTEPWTRDRNSFVFTGRLENGDDPGLKNSGPMHH